MKPEAVKALDLIFLLHADHEQNCSTATVRMVASSRANLFASAAAGVCALWGPLHGGANQAVLEMLEEIHRAGDDGSKFIAAAKDKNSGKRLMGFGHRVYKHYDPRAKIIKKACDEVLAKLHINDPLLDIAKHLEEAALRDSYFVERKLYPNVDFYSGIIMRAIGIPVEMFTVMFAIGRMPGWIANYKEVMEAPRASIGPRQIYTGPTLNHYRPSRSGSEPQRAARGDLTGASSAAGRPPAAPRLPGARRPAAHPAMNIHEYQARQLLAQHGVAAPAGDVCDTPEAARTIAEQLLAAAPAHRGQVADPCRRPRQGHFQERLPRAASSSARPRRTFTTRPRPCWAMCSSPSRPAPKDGWSAS